MKRILIIASIAIAVLLVIALSLPFLINVDRFRPEIETKLSAVLGRTVHIGRIDASLFSGGAAASDIAISDDPAYSTGPFLQASSVQIGLKWIPLIFSREIKVTGIAIVRPEITLLKNSAGKWNYASLGNTSAQKTSASSGPAPDFSVDKFEIRDGKVKIGDVSGKTVRHEQAFEKVNFLAHNISMHSVMPFTLTAATPGGGALDVEGQAGPLDATDTSRTPLDAKISLEHADLGAAGMFDPSSGLGGTLDFDSKIKSDGHKVHTEGKAKANNLRLVKGGSPARPAVNLDYVSDGDLESQLATINTTLHVGGSQANAGGTINSHGESAVAHLKITGKNMAVNDVEGLLPALGVVLPQGASLQGGVANLNLTADGPLDRLVITGPADITGTHLNGYNLNSKLGAIGALAGLQPNADTLIQTFSSALRVAPEGIRADNIVLDVPSMGQLTGNGVISGNNALDFKMLLKVSGNAAGGLVGKLTGGAQSGGIPFVVRGTTSNPTFAPSGLSIGNAGDAIKALQGKPGQDQSGLGGVLGGFLNKKKKP